MPIPCGLGVNGGGLWERGEAGKRALGAAAGLARNWEGLDAARGDAWALRFRSRRARDWQWGPDDCRPADGLGAHLDVPACWCGGSGLRLAAQGATGGTWPALLPLLRSQARCLGRQSLPAAFHRLKAGPIEALGALQLEQGGSSAD